MRPVLRIGSVIAMAIVMVVAPLVGARPVAAATPDVYVALGDSYTAAPFAGVPTGRPIDCGRSDDDYPQLAALELHAPVLRDESCSGATTGDFSSAQSGLVLGGTAPPQFDALGPDVRLVTVGIGGNDIGFSDVVSACVQLPTQLGGKPCTPTFVHDGADELAARIAAAAPHIGAALERIHQLAPAATILVVGYPAILPDTGDGCYPYVPVLAPDVPYLRATEKRLNAMLRAEAVANAAGYVDWYTPSIGHDACEPPGFAWVNAVVVVPPSFVGHPNVLGELGAADAIAATARSRGIDWRLG